MPTIALIGGEEFAPGFEDVHTYILSLAQRASPCVVFFSTAASSEGAAVVDKWANLARDHFTQLGAQVEIARVVDDASANDDAFVEMTQRADVIYLGGGLPHVLLSLLRDTPVWRAILRAHDSGSILAGASAGAMVLGQHALVAAHANDYPPSQWSDGLNVLPALASHRTMTPSRAAGLRISKTHYR